MDTGMIFFIVCGAVLAAMIVYYTRRRHKLLSALFGSASGFAALLLVNRFGGELGAYLPLNAFNICGSTVLGAPFVAAMIICKYI
ncbi:MAG: pro-sigmaK processing inhibitor BofA family protein [Ruminococcus sp.]|nr:pro-sigmaK processing inhibitor BofA family protein [Ruminococcus sp.]